ncbi:MAG: hypothetical protein ACYC4R_15100 [Anaerolineae bacterium]
MTSDSEGLAVLLFTLAGLGIALLISVGIFLVFRQIVLWYWKINRIEALLAGIDARLAAIGYDAGGQGLRYLSASAQEQQRLLTNIAYDIHALRAGGLTVGGGYPSSGQELGAAE